MGKESGTISLRDSKELYQRKNTEEIIERFKDDDVFKGKFLDIGCADGWTIERLQNKFGCDGVGVTIDEDDLVACKRYNIKCRLCDAVDLPFEDDTFDLVYSRHTLEHVKNPLKAIDEIKRVVKNDGKVLISVPEYNLKYQSCPSHYFVLPFDCWGRLFAHAGFNITKTSIIIDFETEYVFLLEKKK